MLMKRWQRRSWAKTKREGRDRMAEKISKYLLGMKIVCVVEAESEEAAKEKALDDLTWHFDDFDFAEAKVLKK